LFWLYWSKNKKPASQKNFHKNKNQKKPPIKLKNQNMAPGVGFEPTRRKSATDSQGQRSMQKKKTKQRKEQKGLFY
jgi:hypothetical protein